MTIFLVSVAAWAGAVSQSDVFISEYVEGSCNTKALELHNPTSERIVEDISKFEYARGTSAELAAEVRAETEQARTQARNGQRKRACE